MLSNWELLERALADGRREANRVAEQSYSEVQRRWFDPDPQDVRELEKLSRKELEEGLKR